MSEYDYVFVGGGINALVAAAMLGKKRRTTLVLERNSAIGGCLRTEEVTAPGFLHDVMATTLVLFRTSPAYQALGKDLEARGFAFADTNLPTAVLRPDGSSVILSMDRARNVKTFDALAEGDGGAFAAEMEALGADAPFLFALLGGSLWSSGIAKTLARELWRRGPRNLAEWFGEALAPARGYLEATYRSEAVRDLWAPWVLHTGLGPESAYSAAMVKVIAFAVEAAGCPIAVGGAKTLLAAFERLIVDQGGAVRPSADVVRIIPDAGSRASGVELANGEKITAAKGVICSTGPEQLYNGLLKDWPVPAPHEVRRGLKAFRHGKGDMQIHYALKSPPRWRGDPDLAKVALIHLTSGLDGVSRAANEAERGLLPAEPTICVGQPTALDPSRAPPGAAILWLQLPEAPRFVKGDAAQEIEAPADGRWTEAMRESYADRIELRLAAHIENWAEIKLARRAYSPADLETMNINLVGGDPYGGACSLDQSFLWRPFKSSVNHRTLRSERLSHRRFDPSGPRPGRRFRLPARVVALADVRPHGMSMEQRFSGQIMQRDVDPAARQATLGEIGINQFAPYLMNRIMERWNGNLAEALKLQNMSTTMMRALAVLSISSPVTINELSAYAVTEQSTMSRTLDILEAQGLVRRQRRAEDMRIRDVSITEEGRAAFERVWPMMHARFQTLFDGVEEEEYRAFTATLLKILRNVAKLPE